MDIDFVKTLTKMNPMFKNIDPSIVDSTIEQLADSYDFKNYGQKRSKEDIIKRHQQKVDQYEQAKHFKGEHTFIHSHHNRKQDRKPSMKRKRNHQYQSIRISNLTPGTTHVSRVLKGTLIGRLAIMTSIHVILQDEFGDVVMVCLYNVYPGDQWNYMDVIEKRFKAGTYMEIVEPFYKIAADGSLIVRVDDFGDVCLFDKMVEEKMDWKLKGNQFFGDKEYESAIGCYVHGLEEINGADVLVSVVKNVSCVYFKLGKYLEAFMFAVCSLALDASKKSYYRLGQALKCLGEKEVSNYCLKVGRGKVALPERLVASDLVSDCICSRICYLTFDIEDLPKGNAISLKETGNVAFGQGQYNEALKLYLGSLNDMADASVLLSNIAIANFKLDNYLDTIIYCTSVAAFGNISKVSAEKALYYRTKALSSIDKFKYALETCTIGLEVEPNSSILSDCFGDLSYHQNINKPKELRYKTTELDQANLFKENAMSIEAVSQMNQMLSMLSMKSGKSLLEDRIREYHIDFFRLGYCDTLEIDQDRIQEYLHQCYELSRSIRMHEAAAISNHFDENAVYKRIGRASIESVNWFQEAPIGDIRKDDDNIMYLPNLFHSFTNSENMRIDLSFGANHVSIGFVTLGQLLWANYENTGAGQLFWSGYDISPYAVAKSLVLYTMMKMGSKVDNILQVWYSSCWSQSALKDFKLALSMILESHLPNESVRYLISLWKLKDVSKKIARSQWLASITENSFADILDLEDQMQFIQYTVTGQLLKGTVGSVMMFATPNQFGTKSLNECFIQTIPTEVLFNARVNSPGKSFIQIGIDLIREKISILKEYIEKEMIVIDLQVKEINATSTLVHREIQSKHPSTISWSNVSDYFSMDSFRDILLNCSTKETTHYLYSMNWITRVKGTFIIDYIDTEKKKTILSKGKDKIKEEYKKQRISPYLLTPPATNARNIAGYLLRYEYYESYAKKFLQGTKKCKCWLNGYNTFSRSNSELYMVFQMKK